VRGWLALLLIVPLMVGFSPPGPDRDAAAPSPVSYLPLAGKGFEVGAPPTPLISALYYDAYLANEPDEAFQLYNPAPAAISLKGWGVSDGSHTVTFPSDLLLSAHGAIWCAREAASFQIAFGMLPACEYATDSDPTVPNLTGSPLRFANTGGQVLLLNPGGLVQDTLVYKAGNAAVAGWQGPSVYPYRPTNAFRKEGQILYRKLDQSTGRPVPDTGTRADWASDPSDPVDGRKVQFPGWDLERFFLPETRTEKARLEVFVAPDNAFASLEALLKGAAQSVRFEGYTFENARLAEVVADRARAGREVEIMLDGAPPGGVTDQQRWVVQQIAQAGGLVHYFKADPATGVHRRYSYQHSKLWLLDGKLALIGSENPSPDSFPDDDPSDGTSGRRGVYLATDAPSVVAGVTAIMDADIAPGAHRDVWRWDPADPVLGAPPAGFTPSYDSGGASYPVQKPAPLEANGTFTFELLHAPEQALRTDSGLLGLIARAGARDTILVEQLYEHTYWGPEDSNIVDDPNPRLEAYIAAARRGAKVRVLLDSFFDDQDLDSPKSNLRTVEYLRSVAAAESLDLQAERRNPTGLGIHNKMILAEIAGQGWVLVGSLNGGEASAKLNREMALLVASAEAYRYLADVFWYDWGEPP